MQPESAQFGDLSVRPRPDKKLTTRSRLTNDALSLPLDGRSTWGRRRRDLIRQLTAELGRKPNTRDVMLITNLASAQVRSEQVQCQIARGESINDEEYVRLGNVITRLIGALRLRSSPDRSPPSLSMLLRSER